MTQHTVIWECGCEECGSDVEIATTAHQLDPSGGDIYVYDGDRGVCCDCGRVHIVSLDAETPPELYAVED